MPFKCFNKTNMRVVPSLLTPPPPPPKSVMPVLYYGLVVVVTAAIVLAVYNLVIIRLCTDHHLRRSGQRTIRTLEPTSSRSFDNLNIHLVSSFKYKKEQEVAQDQGGEHECPVCLSVFEEGEEVRQLPRCKHSFHAPCIDMWLYSHFDCPVCRAPVEPPALRPQMVTDRSENSREGLLDIAISV